MQIKKNITYTLVVNISRVVLSLVLVVSGFVKAVDPVGFMYKLQEYTKALSVEAFSDDWLLFFAIVMAALEFLMGVFMFMGVYRRFISTLAFALMIVFTIFTTYVYFAAPVDDCGCFGDAFELTNGATVIKNILLLLLAAAVSLGRRRLVWNISARNRWLVVIFSFFYIAVVEGMSLSSLPVLDFRPYAVGNNLREMVEGTPDVYEIKHVYEKDGERRAFSDSLPDLSWNFVENYSELVKEGEEPLIGDFSIVDWETDEDIAAGLLADTGYVCIVAIEFVEKASVSRVDKVNDLYDYCVENNVPFLAATASGEEEIALWRRRTGAEYPIYWADNMMLRTMVRSNPGIVLLNNGVVVGKWSADGIPDVDSYSSSPKASNKLFNEFDRNSGMGFWMLLLIVPLAAIGLLDALMARGKRSGKDRVQPKKIAPLPVEEPAVPEDKGTDGEPEITEEKKIQ